MDAVKDPSERKSSVQKSHLSVGRCGDAHSKKSSVCNHTWDPH